MIMTEVLYTPGFACGLKLSVSLDRMTVCNFVFKLYTHDNDMVFQIISERLIESGEGILQISKLKCVSS